MRARLVMSSFSEAPQRPSTYRTRLPETIDTLRSPPLVLMNVEQGFPGQQEIQIV